MSDPFDDPWDEPDQASYWKWEEEGQEIRGEVMSVGWENSGTYGYGDQLVIQVRHQDGQAYKVTCTAMLQRAIEEQRPAPGDQVRIKYFGDRPMKRGGNTYKVIQMRLRRRDPEAVPPPAPLKVLWVDVKRHVVFAATGLKPLQMDGDDWARAIVYTAEERKRLRGLATNIEADASLVDYWATDDPSMAERIREAAAALREAAGEE